MKYLILFILTLLISIYIFVSRNETIETFSANNKLSYTLPSFTIQNIDNKSFLSKDLLFENTVLHFWASWCGPCMEELHELKNFALEMPKVKFYLIAVNDQREAVVKLMKRYDFPANCEVYMDVGSVVAEKMGTFKLPESYIVKSGKVVRRLQGPQKWTEVSAIEVLLLSGANQ